MKIVDFKEFACLPKGTVYQMYESRRVNPELLVKERTLFSKDDQTAYNFSRFNATIIDAIPELCEEEAIHQYEDVAFTHDRICSRWDLFDYDMLYLIYETEDINKLVSFLTESTEQVNE